MMQHYLIPLGKESCPTDRNLVAVFVCDWNLPLAASGKVKRISA